MDLFFHASCRQMQKYHCCSCKQIDARPAAFESSSNSKSKRLRRWIKQPEQRALRLTFRTQFSCDYLTNLIHELKIFRRGLKFANRILLHSQLSDGKTVSLAQHSDRVVPTSILVTLVPSFPEYYANFCSCLRILTMQITQLLQRPTAILAANLESFFASVISLSDSCPLSPLDRHNQPPMQPFPHQQFVLFNVAFFSAHYIFLYFRLPLLV